MENAVENALNRASAEQRERAQQVIEEARRNIRLVSVRDDISSTDGDAIARNAHTIEEAKKNIPFETMKDVDTISAPLPTPAQRGHYNSTIIELHPNEQSNIESIEKGEGNNYLRENAIDRAMARQDQEIQRPDQGQSLGR